MPTTLYSTPLASTDASGDTDDDEIEDASSKNLEDEVFSDDGIDDDEVEDGSSNDVEDEVFSNDGVDNGDTDDDEAENASSKDLEDEVFSDDGIDDEEVEDGSSNDLEDEVFSDDGVDNGDIDNDEVELSTTSTAQATETQTNQEIGSSLLQHDRVLPRYTVVDSTFYDNLGEDKCDEVMHNVLARIRLPKIYGGTEKAIEIEILNDTGSSYQCVFEADLEEMEYNCHTYRGYTGKVLLCTCNGVTSRESLWVELQLLKPDRTSFGGWFLEQTAIENMELCGGVRVTGSQIRKEFYFATTPGKRHLFVAKVAQTAWFKFSLVRSGRTCYPGMRHLSLHRYSATPEALRERKSPDDIKIGSGLPIEEAGLLPTSVDHRYSGSRWLMPAVHP